ncbi:MAG TPA: DUF3822 family protein [Bacteroidales bacterium]
MHQINLLDETFDKNQAHNYNLSIQYGLNGLSFCLFDIIRSKFIAFRHYPETESKPESLPSLLEHDDLLSLAFKETYLLYDAGQSILIPTPYFDESKASDYYKFTLTPQTSSTILYNKLPSSIAANIFSCPDTTIEKFKKVFPSLTIFHRSTPFIENMIQESAHWPRTKCYISIHQGIIDIGLAHLKKLEFFNSFTYREKPDIAYYILNVLEQFKLPTICTDTFVSADMERHDDIFEYLNHVLAHIKFIRPSDKFTYSYIFDEFQLTRFANLFNLSLCV